MKKSWISALLFTLTTILLFLFVALGVYGLLHVPYNIAAYGMLGLGLGGLIALWNAWRASRSS